MQFGGAYIAVDSGGTIIIMNYRESFMDIFYRLSFFAILDNFTDFAAPIKLSIFQLRIIHYYYFRCTRILGGCRRQQQ